MGRTPSSTKNITWSLKCVWTLQFTVFSNKSRQRSHCWLEKRDHRVQGRVRSSRNRYTMGFGAGKLRWVQDSRFRKLVETNEPQKMISGLSKSFFANLTPKLLSDIRERIVFDFLLFGYYCKCITFFRCVLASLNNFYGKGSKLFFNYSK